MNDIHQNDDAFDAAMRDRYQLAIGAVSAGTRARLRQVRNTAATGTAHRHGWSWPLLLGGAAAAAFVAATFGLALYRVALPGGDAAPSTVAAQAGYQEPVSALDEDPDFYAWLGSPDAELVAVE
jgi:hypothetical protein